jgi:hypothetical protein
MRRYTLLLAALIAAVLSLLGCAPRAVEGDPAVPLADGQPTFLFFFTNP